MADFETLQKTAELLARQRLVAELSRAYQRQTRLFADELLAALSAARDDPRTSQLVIGCVLAQGRWLSDWIEAASQETEIELKLLLAAARNGMGGNDAPGGPAPSPVWRACDRGVR